MNESDWTESLIDTLATFSVTVPSQNPYKSNKISSQTPKLTLRKIPKMANFLNIDFLKSTFFPINVKYQWDFLTNRALELMYQGRKRRNLELVW